VVKDDIQLYRLWTEFLKEENYTTVSDCLLINKQQIQKYAQKQRQILTTISTSTQSHRETSSPTTPFSF